MRNEDPYISCEPDNRYETRRETTFLTATQEIKNMRASSQFYISFASLEKASLFRLVFFRDSHGWG